MFEEDENELPPTNAADYDRVGEMIRQGRYIQPEVPPPDAEIQQNIARAMSAPTVLNDNMALLQTIQARLDSARMAQEEALNQTYSRAAPSESEKWLAIAAALGRPTQHGSVGEVIGNVSDALLGYKRSAREVDMARQQELMRLRQGYETMAASALAKGVRSPGSGQIWSEQLGRFIPKDRPVAIATGTDAAGRHMIRYSDGTIRSPNPDGSMDVYDGGSGERIGVIPPEGGAPR